jgi:hypothetical protein
MSDNEDHHDTDSKTIANLSEFVLKALQQFPLGLSEYELIKYIQTAGNLHFKKIALWDKLSLFHTHFILFHSLYTLRDELWQSSAQVLDISPLKIILYHNDEQQTSDQRSPAEYDPLRDYYLNLDNLHDTTEKDVNELLTGFWTRLGANEQRESALKILELEDPVDYILIKKQYKRLVMQHHPDRGGDKVMLQTLNYAMSILEKSERG